MKRFVILILLSPLIIFAQQKPLMIEGTAPNFYLQHTAAAKENFYSIGRMYNISPREIAPFNNLQLENGLSLNQALKIPLKEENFSQNAQVAEGEVLVPLYYYVKDKESLYYVSSMHNNLLLTSLRQWNNLKTDALAKGAKLVVGYLKVKKDLSPLAAMAKLVTAINTAATPVNTESKPAPVPVKEPVKPYISNETLPVVKNPNLDKTPVKEKEVAVKPVTEKTRSEVVQVINMPQVKETEPAKTAVTVAGKKGSGGYFKNEFVQQSKTGSELTETGAAAVFKSNSGWEDGKYYCLLNSAAAGTIVKVTNSVTGKSIYAKVLDVMPDIKQNNGLLIRLSNAASEELGLSDTRFDCSVNYSK